MHYTWPNGRGSLLMGVEPTRPSYARLVEMLKSVPNTRASRSWVDRVLDINNLKGSLCVSMPLCMPVSVAASISWSEPFDRGRGGLYKEPVFVQHRCFRIGNSSLTHLLCTLTVYTYLAHVSGTVTTLQSHSCSGRHASVSISRPATTHHAFCC